MTHRYPKPSGEVNERFYKSHEMTYNSLHEAVKTIHNNKPPYLNSLPKEDECVQDSQMTAPNAFVARGTRRYVSLIRNADYHFGTTKYRLNNDEPEDRVDYMLRARDISTQVYLSMYRNNCPYLLKAYGAEGKIQNDTLFVILVGPLTISLRVAIRNNEIYDFSAIQNIINCVAKGLRYLHERGVVHGNVSIDSVVYNYRGKVMVTDFCEAEAFLTNDLNERRMENKHYTCDLKGLGLIYLAFTYPQLYKDYEERLERKAVWNDTLADDFIPFFQPNPIDRDFCNAHRSFFNKHSTFDDFMNDELFWGPYDEDMFFKQLKQAELLPVPLMTRHFNLLKKNADQKVVEVKHSDKEYKPKFIAVGTIIYCEIRISRTNKRFQFSFTYLDEVELFAKFRAISDICTEDLAPSDIIQMRAITGTNFQRLRREDPVLYETEFPHGTTLYFTLSKKRLPEDGYPFPRTDGEVTERTE